MIDRILDKLGIELNDMQQDSMQAILHGNKDVVVLSPTGSGKTTTLYAIINKLNTPDKKIITIEDPIEYHLTGI